jgi:hypothetical protein
MRHWLGGGFGFCHQTRGDLGERMAGAFDKSFRGGNQATVIIGSDCPKLTSDLMSEAFACLRHHSVVLGPALDGGYYLIGLRESIPQLFSGVNWGTSTVLAKSQQILDGLGIKPCLLTSLPDLDRMEDLPMWQRIVDLEEGDLGKISIIIPGLNEAQRIGATVAVAAAGAPQEILVVDGGSSDRTVDRAREAGATVVISEPGRARQMNAGAAQAKGNVLLFLHADTELPQGYSTSVAEQLSRAGVVAGAFRFAISDPFPGSKMVEWATNLRSRRLQMPYGDQGLFLRRSLFEELGGFADLPILEDYELVRRLRRFGRVNTVLQSVATSGRRWQRLGFVRTTLINAWVILGYHLGRPIEELAATYRSHEPGSPQKARRTD